MSSPNYATGKICYIEIPTNDIARSADFYHRAFGWHVRQRGDGTTAFDDTVSEVSGSWVPGRQPSSGEELMVYIMVADAARASEAVIAAGGEIVHSNDPDSPEVVVTFRDPAGNIMGIYQQPGLEEAERQQPN
jgi:predicted enzyme related to lactoylglutathione lyase